MSSCNSLDRKIVTLDVPLTEEGENSTLTVLYLSKDVIKNPDQANASSITLPSTNCVCLWGKG